jgi:glycosyltransferase involved in cell wall biosynthesis
MQSDKSDLLDLTIVIPVRNEEKNLEGCLSAIGKSFVKKITIVDSGSTDRTKEIANDFGVEVIDFVWNGRYPKKRNWFLQEHTPTTKWVLFLDADEYLTDDFKKELTKALSREDVCGYWLRYTIYFLGAQLKWGYGLKKLALFRVGKGLYEKIDEDKWSHLDMEIHEHPIIEGKVGEIKAKIDHLDFRGIGHYVIKHNEYSDWEAARFMKLKGDTAVWANLTRKQKLKYRLMESPFIGPLYFCGSYFLMGGILDGKKGLAFSLLKMSYFNEIFCKIRERKVNDRKV